MEELSATLRRERELLDQVRFRFVETRLLLEANELRYLGWAAEEIDQARLRARETDLLRAAHVHRLGDAHGLLRHGTPTLRDVAGCATGPWAGILRDHHEGLCAMVAEIELVGHRNAELARRGLRALAEDSDLSLFDSWPHATRTSSDATQPCDRNPGTAEAERPGQVIALDAIGEQPERCPVGSLADERALQDVIATASRLKMPALLAFLR